MADILFIAIAISLTGFAVTVLFLIGRQSRPKTDETGLEPKARGKAAKKGKGPRLGPYDGPLPEHSDLTRKRISDMRWRAASQVVTLMGAPRVPGLLRKFVEDAEKPVQGAMTLVERLGSDPQRVNPFGPSARDEDRFQFLDRLDAFCVLEDELGAGGFAAEYRAQIVAWVDAGDFSQIRDLADTLSIVREAQDSLRRAGEFAPPTRPDIAAMRSVAVKLIALLEELRHAPPAKPDITRAEALRLAEDASAWFGVADGVHSVIANVDALFSWCQENRVTLDLERLENEIFGDMGRLYSEPMSPISAGRIIDRAESMLIEWARRLKAPRPLSDRRPEQVWSFFGIVHGPPQPDVCRAAYHRLVGEWHPCRSQEVERRNAAEAMMDEIRLNWERARLHLRMAGTPIIRGSFTPEAAAVA